MLGCTEEVLAVGSPKTGSVISSALWAKTGGNTKADSSSESNHNKPAIKGGRGVILVLRCAVL